MFDEPGHLFRRALTSSDEEITFVLPVLVVHNDDELSSSKGSESGFHRGEGGGGSHQRERERDDVRVAG